MAQPTYQLKLDKDMIVEEKFDLLAYVRKELDKRIGELITQYPELPNTHRFVGMSVEKDGDNMIINANFERKKQERHNE